MQSTVGHRDQIVGVDFKSDTSAQFNEDNWRQTTITENKNRIINQRSRRNLNIYVKVLIVKTFIISQFSYITQSVGLPENTVNIINQKLRTFMWKKKYNNQKADDKEKRKILMQNSDEEGLKMVDMKILQNALYLNWVSTLMGSKSDKPQWKTRLNLIFSRKNLRHF